MPGTPLFQLVKKYEQVLKFLVAGGLALATNLFVLYICTDILHIYYMVSTVVAFAIAFNVSFILQKFWTFKDPSKGNMHIQLPLYLGVQLMNMALNALLMYVFVEYLHVWYILSQTIIALMIAVSTFFINKVYIFKPQGV